MMPRIRCHYLDCVFLEEGYCGAAGVEIDPEEGCMTYSRIDEVPEDETWEDPDLEELWEDDDDELYEDEEDIEEADWLEEDDT
jgi:hypothetical protein